MVGVGACVVLRKRKGLHFTVVIAAEVKHSGFLLGFGSGLAVVAAFFALLLMSRWGAVAFFFFGAGVGLPVQLLLSLLLLLLVLVLTVCFFASGCFFSSGDEVGGCCSNFSTSSLALAHAASRIISVSPSIEVIDESCVGCCSSSFFSCFKVQIFPINSPI